MRNYIKSEIFRTLKRPYYRNIVVIISILSILTLLSLNISEATRSYEMIFLAFTQMFRLPIFLVIFFAEIILFEEFKNSTIKNTVVSGLGREKIVVGKFITGIIISVLALFIVSLVYFGVGIILFSNIVGSDFMGIGLGSLFMNLAKVLFQAIFIWLAYLSIIMFAGYTVQSPFGIGFLYFSIISLVPKIIDIISVFKDIEPIVAIKNQIGLGEILSRTINSPSQQPLVKTLIISVLYILVFNFLSIVIFKKREW